MEKYDLYLHIQLYSMLPLVGVRSWFTWPPPQIRSSLRSKVWSHPWPPSNLPLRIASHEEAIECGFLKNLWNKYLTWHDFSLVYTIDMSQKKSRSWSIAIDENDYEITMSLSNIMNTKGFFAFLITLKLKELSKAPWSTHFAWTIKRIKPK